MQARPGFIWDEPWFPCVHVAPLVQIGAEAQAPPEGALAPSSSARPPSVAPPLASGLFGPPVPTPHPASAAIDSNQTPCLILILGPPTTFPSPTPCAPRDHTD